MASQPTSTAVVALNIVNGVLRAVQAAAAPFNAAGVTTVTVAACLSALALVLLLLHMAVLTAVHYYRRAKGRKGERVFVTTHLGIYIASLLVSALIQSAGAAIDSMWLVQKTIPGGMMCSAQALLLQFGNLSTAFFVLYITLHTFNAIVLRKRFPRWALVVSVVALWSLVGFLDLAGPLFLHRANDNFYGPIGGVWCWISPTYAIAALGLVVYPMLIVAALCFMLYFAIFIVVGRGFVMSMRAERGSDSGHSTVSHDTYSDHNTYFIAKYLVWYPAVWVAFTLPMAIVLLVGHTAPDALTAFATTLYSLLGLALVAVYVLTHRVFGGQPWRLGLNSVTLQGTHEKMSSESFVALEKNHAAAPAAPEAWQPVAREWQVPAERTPRASMYSASGSRPNSIASSQHTRTGSFYAVPERPVPPMPLMLNDAVIGDNWGDASIGRARSAGHVRARSDATVVDGNSSIGSARGATLAGRSASYSSSRSAPRVAPPAMPEPAAERQRSIRAAPPPADAFNEFARQRSLHKPTLSAPSRPARAPAPAPILSPVPGSPEQPANFRISIEAPPPPAPVPAPAPASGLARATSMAALARALAFERAASPTPSVPRAASPAPASRAPSPAPSAAPASALFDAPGSYRFARERPESALDTPLPRPFSQDFEMPSAVLAALSAPPRDNSPQGYYGGRADSILGYYSTDSPVVDRSRVGR